MLAPGSLIVTVATRREPIQRRITLGAFVLLAAALIACNREEEASELAAGSVPGTDVPMFRGNPAHTSVQPGADPEGATSVRRRVDTDGAVFSSPAVVDGVVYVGSWDGSVDAVDAESGRQMAAAPGSDRARR